MNLLHRYTINQLTKKLNKDIAKVKKYGVLLLNTNYEDECLIDLLIIEYKSKIKAIQAKIEIKLLKGGY